MRPCGCNSQQALDCEHADHIPGGIVPCPCSCHKFLPEQLSVEPSLPRQHEDTWPMCPADEDRMERASEAIERLTRERDEAVKKRLNGIALYGEEMSRLRAALKRLADGDWRSGDDAHVMLIAREALSVVAGAPASQPHETRAPLTAERIAKEFRARGDGAKLGQAFTSGPLVGVSVYNVLHWCADEVERLFRSQQETSGALDDSDVRALKRSFATFCFETADGSNCPTIEDVQRALCGMHDDLLDELRSQLKATEHRNQCDGCQAGWPVRDGIHYDLSGHSHMTCQADRYK